MKIFNTWKAERNTVFWMGDANGGLEDDDLAEVLSETELYNIMGSKHGINSPKTHINGSQAISFYLGTADALDIVDEVGVYTLTNNIYYVETYMPSPKELPDTSRQNS
eukprot:10067481-Ditylum_brightwellii.AAC.1